MGVPLPADARAEITDVVDGVRAMPLPAGARDVRWVRLEGLHLTLRFLGPTEPERIAPTMAAVQAAAATATEPIEIELSGAGTFPPGRRPRALWIGVTRGGEGLARLAARTEEALVEAGWEPEHRPFRAHLTLARSDGVSVGPLVADRLASAMAGRRIACSLDALGLFESITGGGPARYVPLALHEFGSAAGSGDRVYHQRAPEASGGSPGQT
ncbi:MAG TPA: RNA 2',3'-cyclic phosphodiesterase [Candidatus Limnocylindrales bacterium]